MCCVCASPGSASSTAAGSSTRPLAEVWSTGRSETWCFSYGYPFLIEAQREEVRPGCFFIEKGGILVNHVDTRQVDVAQNRAKSPMKSAKGA